ncbi:MAG: beta-glucuronidase [Porticoccaceae bacterium]|nr:beta-glucuronidase [Porticoccaceae bacterium]|tara:strand:- start:247 stop:2094 length:1848 start_codon:yes stop_codon:yes gene_type:complete
MKNYCFLKILILGKVLLFISTGAHTAENDFAVEYVQNLISRPSISLDGKWARIVDPFENGFYNHRYQPHKDGYFKNKKVQSVSDRIEYNFATAKKLSVPGDWNSQEEQLFFYEGTVWYQKDFDLVKKADKKYIIQFGAVNYHAIVYINGNEVGQHEGGFTSFQFDITKELKDGANFVVVKVDNRRSRDQVPTVNTDWWNYGGITRSVIITELPLSHINDYYIGVSTHIDGGIEGYVEITTAERETSDVVLISIPELGIKYEASPDKNGLARFAADVSPGLWSPKTPKLYGMEISFLEDRVSDQIGFRTISANGDEIYLNGSPIFLKGISIHEESPLNEGRAWSAADAHVTLSWAKELGANFVRLAHYPHNEAMIKAADQLGLMVWSEIPVYWTILFDNKAVYANAERQLTEMITRDKNRAAIVMWSVANETPLSENRLSFLKKLIKKTRSLDPSRLVTAAIDTQDKSENEIVLRDPLADYLDVIGINSYCGWYWGLPEDCAKKTWDSSYNKPIIMSEMGGGAKQGLYGNPDQIWTEEFQAAVYEHNLVMAQNIKGLSGLSPWILKDFRSPRRHLNHVQDFWNRKGLVSERGVRKKAWYVLRDFYVSLENGDRNSQ